MHEQNGGYDIMGFVMHAIVCNVNTIPRGGRHQTNFILYEAVCHQVFFQKYVIMLDRGEQFYFWHETQ